MVVAGRASGCGMVVAPFASHVPPASFAPVSGEGRCAPHYPPSCSISEGVLAPTAHTLCSTSKYEMYPAAGGSQCCTPGTATR